VASTSHSSGVNSPCPLCPLHYRIAVLIVHAAIIAEREARRLPSYMHQGIKMRVRRVRGVVGQRRMALHLAPRVRIFPRASRIRLPLYLGQQS
jgi:hypothetical protein